MTRRLAARLALACALFAGVTVLTASPATALLGICGDPESPTPSSPGTGIVAVFGTPDPLPKDPAGQDGAWSDELNAPLMANYSASSAKFNTYDLGCAGTDDPMAPVWTGIANAIMMLSRFAVGGVGALLGAAYNPTYLQVFNPILEQGSATLRAAIVDKWMVVSLAVIGFFIVVKARKARASDVTRTLVWATAVLVVTFGLMNWPVTVGSAADDTVTTAVGAVNNSLNGTTDTPAEEAASATLATAVEYVPWQIGVFGSANSPTAVKYSKPIWTSTHLTYEEAEVVAGDPGGAGKDLIEEKKALFADTAATIKEEDPGAYAYLTGAGTGWERMGAAVLSNFAALCGTPFLLAAALLMIGAFLIFRLAVLFFPVMAVVGVNDRFQGAVRGVGNVVAAAGVNVICFGVAGAIGILGIRIILGAGLAMWLALVLTGVWTFVLWYALRPMRKLTQMVAPDRVFSDASGAIGDTAKKIRDTAWQVGKQAAATAAGIPVGAALADREPLDKGIFDDDDQTPRAEQYSSDETHRVWSERIKAQPGEIAPALAPAALPAEASHQDGPYTMPAGTTVSEPAQQTTTTPTGAPATAGAPAALPPGPTVTTTPDIEATLPDQIDGSLNGAVAPEQGAVDNGEAPFVPDRTDDTAAEAPSLPVAVEPVIDAATGQEVYDLYVPEETVDAWDLDRGVVEP